MNETETVNKERINPELAVKIAIKQNRIRNEIELLNMERSEKIKEFNAIIKQKHKELADADEEWRTGAVQMDFGFMEEEDE